MDLLAEMSGGFDTDKSGDGPGGADIIVVTDLEGEIGEVTELEGEIE